jgi:hypothetical protein
LVQKGDEIPIPLEDFCKIAKNMPPLIKLIELFAAICLSRNSKSKEVLSRMLPSALLVGYLTSNQLPTGSFLHFLADSCP